MGSFGTVIWLWALGTISVRWLLLASALGFVLCSVLLGVSERSVEREIEMQWFVADSRDGSGGSCTVVATAGRQHTVERDYTWMW